jgi:hypothetical protein
LDGQVMVWVLGWDALGMVVMANNSFSENGLLGLDTTLPFPDQLKSILDETPRLGGGIFGGLFLFLRPDMLPDGRTHKSRFVRWVASILLPSHILKNPQFSKSPL